MKTKTFFLLCLFLGIGLTRISAQNGKNGTGAVTTLYHGDWDEYYIDIPVACNNTEVDRLVGKVTVSGEVFFKLGVFMHENKIFIGEVSSVKTGEIFSVNDHWKWEFPNLYGSGHCNLKGNMGSHYLLIYTMDFYTDTFIFEKAVCN